MSIVSSAFAQSREPSSGRRTAAHALLTERENRLHLDSERLLRLDGVFQVPYPVTMSLHFSSTANTKMRCAQPVQAVRGDAPVPRDKFNTHLSQNASVYMSTDLDRIAELLIFVLTAEACSLMTVDARDRREARLSSERWDADVPI